TMVLGITIVTMGYLAGVPKRILAAFLVLGVLGFLGLSLKDDYSRQRLLTMLNPESDPYGAGYQLLQGFYAFGSGGLFGVGIGFSKQKYSYLPMAHNDFIFAVIGEECGLVGTLGLLAGFALFAWAGFRIALHAPDLAGRLIAAGCTTLVVIQMLLNVVGVIGIFPLSGKPIPFVSYGGSSVIASLMLAGMVVSVSVHSRLPETAHDGARRSLRVTEGDAADAGLSLVGEPLPRSARGVDAGRAPRLTVMDGGARGRAAGRGRGRPAGRVTTDARGRRRVDLGPDAAERLRGRRGPRGRR
ncbi:FtsW/RodA/SpoVE family cell cycle protein, partial [Thermophilibacter provencensis]|uniref:FtsW/RodA/SpoVE family cell cycle protein n=1 Tax=Thermophilibacter provencensis TaxID=1852386 RepID=UPI003AA7B91D